MPTTSANIPKSSAPTPTGNVGKVYGTYTTESEKKAAASNDWLLPKDRKAEDAKIAASKSTTTTPVKKIPAPATTPKPVPVASSTPASGSSVPSPITGSMIRPDGLDGIIKDIKKPNFSEVTMPNIGNIIKKPSLPGIGTVLGVVGTVAGVGTIAKTMGGGNIIGLAKNLATEQLQTKAQELVTSKLAVGSVPEIGSDSKIANTLSSLKG